MIEGPLTRNIYSSVPSITLPEEAKKKDMARSNAKLRKIGPDGEQRSALGELGGETCRVQRPSWFALGGRGVVLMMRWIPGGAMPL